jgi:hypothetical protein
LTPFREFSDCFAEHHHSIAEGREPMSKTQRAATLARMTCSLATAVVIGLVLVWSGPASAQQAKCLAGKTKCMSKKATGLLKCEQTAETPGKPTDTSACREKVVGKFDGGVDPSKGCFDKLENKKGSDCITSDDTGAAESAVDSCVAAFVADIDPSAMQTKCGVGKKKCVSKLLGSLLKCQATAQTPGKSTDPNAGGCVDKATAKYTGGADPTKGCFAKLENKNGSDCSAPLGNSLMLQDDVTSCVAALVNLESNTTTTTSTTTTTTLLTGVTINGALTSTPGRFNYNLTLGLPGANAACDTNFPGSHACTYPELQSVAAAGDLVGLKDIGNNTVTSFWAIDSTQPALQQCNDDAMGGSGLNWEYATAHTASRGEKVDLDNAAGTLGPLQMSLQCNFSGNAWVGCCQ